jgi:DDE superfamily endonuclease
MWKEVTCQAPPAAALVDQQSTECCFLTATSPHLELPFVEYCEEYDIIPFCFPPHLTHLVQPLDVSVFGVFKHHHKVCIQDKVRTGDLDFSVFDFLSAFETFHKETFTYHTVLNGWKATGLDPRHVNSSVIIARLGDFLERKRARGGAEGKGSQGTAVPTSQTTECRVFN